MAPYFRHTSGSSKIHWSEWDDLCLAHLFDPEKASIDHLPIREQLKYYKKRDLMKTKFYNIRLKCWGLKAPDLVRERILEVDGGGKTSAAFSGKETLNQKLYSDMDDDFYEDGVKEFKDPKSSVCYQKFKQTLEASLRIEEKVGINSKELDSKVSLYNSWVKQRMTLRSEFDQMVNFEKMSSQPQLTPLQILVAQRFLEWKYPSKEMETPVEEKSQSDSMRQICSPRIERPLPDLYKNLEEYISLNGMRWFDLFNQIDREKSWDLTTDKILSLLQSLGAHVTKADADDFVNFFDTMGTGKITYKDLITKRAVCKTKERRSKAGTRVKVDSDEKFDQFDSSSFKSSTARGLRLKKYMTSPTLDSLTANLTDTSAGDGNVAVFAMYENDPRLYKQELIRSSRVNSKRSSRASSFTSKDYLSVLEKTNMTEKTEKQSIGSRKSSSISTPRYRKLPSRLQPIGKETPVSEGQYITSPMTNKSETPLEADFIELKTETLVSKITGTESRPKLDKQLREQTFTSLKPKQSESSEFLKFRKRCWEDYIKIKKLFVDQGLVMSEEALQRALLFPREKTKAQLKKSVAVPRQADIQLKPPKSNGLVESSESNAEESSASINGIDNIDQSDELGSRPSLTSGTTTRNTRASDMSSDDYKIRPPAKNQHFDARFQYPKNKRPATHGAVDQLSTGSALIKPKTDCWMTFDEYVSFCRKMAPTFHKISPLNKDAFWPGYMLDKLVLPFTGRERSVDNLFTHVKQDQNY